ncbi:MAG: hypothetical protein GY866_20560 [Proteobacteria bacterium]|nr:hypothetical protein [Pseudomonadota bacterium]
MKLFFCCIWLIIIPFVVWAEESSDVEDDPFAVSEEDMFSDSDTVEAVENYKDDRVTEKIDSGSVGLSGDLKGSALYSFATDKAKDDPSIYGHDDAYSASIEGDILLDARWKYGMKIFCDYYVIYTPVEDKGREPLPIDDDEDDYDIVKRELFGDFNIAQKAYFRIGKQTLKWGKGYLWNPTDLISIDQKDFKDIDARREGVYGLKMHIPFGTKLNIYAFVNTTGTEKYSESASAAKVEFLVLDDVEMSFSGWTKKDYKPVYGFDIAFFGFDTQWRGELSLTQGGNQHYLVKENGMYVDNYDSQEIIPRMSMGFTKQFDIGDINDRLSLTGEFLYNHKGYEENMLEETPLTPPGGFPIPNYTLKNIFLLGEYYIPNYYGKYYAAVFAFLSRLFNDSDLSLSASAISNLSDSSSSVSTSLNYSITFDTSASIQLAGYLGQDNREYTLSGNRGNVKMSFSMVF